MIKKQVFKCRNVFQNDPNFQSNTTVIDDSYKDYIDITLLDNIES